MRRGCLTLLALLMLHPGCGDRRDPPRREEPAARSIPLERLEPIVRDQLEAAIANAETGGPADAAHVGMLVYSYGFPDRAVHWLRRALAVEANPTWDHALGLALSELGRPEEAAGAFESVLRARPDDVAAGIRLAEIRLELGRLHQALELFESLSVRGGANEVHARAGAGRALVLMGRPERAREQLEAALALAPGHTQARYSLAEVLRDRGEIAASALHFERARADSGRTPPIDDPVARAIDDLATGATTALQRGMELRRRSADYAAAAAWFEEAVRQDPELAAAHAELGATRLALGDLSGAAASLRQALRLDPQSAGALYNLALIAHREGRTADAFEGFRAVTAIRPYDFDALLGLGVTGLAGGNGEAGVPAMERAIAVRPDDPRPYRHLHTYHERAGREREAIAVLERGRRALPQDGSILLRLAWSLATSPSATLRDPQRALTLARRIAGSTDHPKVQDTLAAALAANGSFRQAAEQAGQALLAAESAGDVELARAIRARVSLYESGKPYVR